MHLTEEEVQRLRENGFSDQDINEYAAGLQQQAQPEQSAGPVQPTELPMVSEVDIPKTPMPPEPTFLEGASTALASAPAGAQLVKDVAIPTAGIYGAYKGLQTANKGIEAWREASKATQAVEAGRAARAAARVPVSGPVAPAQSPIVNSAGRPMPMSTGPAPVVRESVGMRNMPGQAATGTAATGVMARGAEYAAKIRELAAQKAMQAAPTAARVGVGATAAITPGNVGQNYNVPQAGPLRGSEINPQTGRGWTPEELARYNAQYNR
jgi:hypothetical protein